jgi:hypothetical protein
LGDSHGLLGQLTHQDYLGLQKQVKEQPQGAKDQLKSNLYESGTSMLTKFHR